MIELGGISEMFYGLVGSKQYILMLDLRVVYLCPCFDFWLFDDGLGVKSHSHLIASQLFFFIKQWNIVNKQPSE